MDQDSWRKLLLELHAAQKWDELAKMLSEASSEVWATPVVGRDLSNIHLPGLRASGLQIHYAWMNGADLSNAFLEGIHFYGVSGNKTNFSGARIQGLLSIVFQEASFRNADLRGSSLEGDFRYADFRGCNLKDVSFGLASCFDSADFSDAKLGSDKEPSHLGTQGENVQFLKARMRNVDMNGLDLKIPKFDKADLTGAILDNTAFVPGEEDTRASFRNACLRDVRAVKADFHFADMRGCDFSSADLTGASLEGCDLRDAILKNAVLKGTYLVNALASAGTQWPEGFNPVSARVRVE